MADGSRQVAYWVDSAPDLAWPEVPVAGLDVGVAVVGGGLVGITAALLLRRAGRSVALLESRRIGRQVTGGTTAKITSQHGLIYSDLVRHFGEDGARAYGESNQWALEWIAGQIRDKGIDCDFERQPAYIYTQRPERVEDLEEEAETAMRLGLPATFERKAPLPYDTCAAVRFDGQAQFHPLKYLMALAEELRSGGVHVLENTRVLDVDEGTPCRVMTDRGEVRAMEVIVATNLPILDRGGFFAKAFPMRHMAIAAHIPRAAAPEGMFISVEEPSRSVRSTPYDDDRRLLILVGEAFKTGHGDTVERQRALAEFARRHFGIEQVAYRWGNQDYYSADRVPYIGRLTPASAHVRVACGFNAWGITTGTLAAHILADDVLGQPNPWARLYDSTRVKPGTTARTLLHQNLHVAKGWVQDRIQSKAEKDIADLRPGEGAIVRSGGEEVAAYRDEAGVVHALSQVCTHMGCHVRWNTAERSWDCPCHGSRFSIDGGWLNGPAVKDLEPKPAGP